MPALKPPTWAPRIGALVAQALGVLLVAAVAPRGWCGLGADAWISGDKATVRALADEVAARAAVGVGPADLHTGSAQFDGEWALVQNQMSVLGLGQHLLRHPDDGPRYLPAIRAAVGSLLRPEARAFGSRIWGEDGFATLDSDHGHVYLGYLAMGLGMARLVDPDFDPTAAALHDRLCSALERRLSQSPHGLIETFPGVTFPADVASAIGAIGLHARATRRSQVPFLELWSQTFRQRWIEPRTGFVFQTADPVRGVPMSSARGSGTALVIYFVSFADASLARSLDAAVAARGIGSFLGFAGVREYPDGQVGAGDIDSGPVVFGISVSASGFGLAGPKLFGDRDRFASLYRTANLFGAPVARGARRSYLVGGGLGDAILLATMTAGPGGAVEDAP